MIKLPVESVIRGQFMQLDTVAQPSKCYECNKPLNWRLRLSPIGLIGLVQCCGSEYIYNNRDVTKEQKMKKVKTPFWLWTVAGIVMICFIPFIVFSSQPE